jgi:hypothetical protein
MERSGKHPDFASPLYDSLHKYGGIFRDFNGLVIFKNYFKFQSLFRCTPRENREGDMPAGEDIKAIDPGRNPLNGPAPNLASRSSP